LRSLDSLLKKVLLLNLRLVLTGSEDDVGLTVVFRLNLPVLTGEEDDVGLMVELRLNVRGNIDTSTSLDPRVADQPDQSVELEEVGVEDPPLPVSTDGDLDGAGIIDVLVVKRLASPANGHLHLRLIRTLAKGPLSVLLDRQLHQPTKPCLHPDGGGKVTEDPVGGTVLFRVGAEEVKIDQTGDGGHGGDSESRIVKTVDLAMGEAERTHKRILAELEIGSLPGSVDGADGTEHLRTEDVLREELRELRTELDRLVERSSLGSGRLHDLLTVVRVMLNLLNVRLLSFGEQRKVVAHVGLSKNLNLQKISIGVRKDYSSRVSEIVLPFSFSTL